MSYWDRQLLLHTPIGTPLDVYSVSHPVDYDREDFENSMVFVTGMRMELGAVAATATAVSSSTTAIAPPLLAPATAAVIPAPDLDVFQTAGSAPIHMSIAAAPALDIKPATMTPAIPDQSEQSIDHSVEYANKELLKDLKTPPENELAKKELAQKALQRDAALMDKIPAGQKEEFVKKLLTSEGPRTQLYTQEQREMLAARAMVGDSLQSDGAAQQLAKKLSSQDAATRDKFLKKYVGGTENLNRLSAEGGLGVQYFSSPYGIGTVAMSPEVAKANNYADLGKQLQTGALKTDSITNPKLRQAVGEITLYNSHARVQDLQTKVTKLQEEIASAEESKIDPAKLKELKAGLKTIGAELELAQTSDQKITSATAKMVSEPSNTKHWKNLAAVIKYGNQSDKVSAGFIDPKAPPAPIASATKIEWDKIIQASTSSLLSFFQRMGQPYRTTGDLTADRLALAERVRTYKAQADANRIAQANTALDRLEQFRSARV